FCIYIDTVLTTIFTLSLHDALPISNDTEWAESGHELCFGEYIFQHQTLSDEITDGQVKVIDGDVNIGIHGEHYQIMLTSPSITLDRKSTRLNSSHVSISYAVFCLKK